MLSEITELLGKTKKKSKLKNKVALMHCKKVLLGRSHGQEEKSKEIEILFYHPLTPDSN